MARIRFRPVSRRTMANFPSSVRREMPAFYTQMFIEDLNSGILGSYSERRKEGRGIIVQGDEEAIVAARSLCASLARGPMYSAAKTTESAIESVALHLSWYGRAVYEICGDKGRELSLVSVPPYHLFQVPGAFVQLIPVADRRWSQGRWHSFLPTRLAWVVRMPKSLGGAIGYRRLLHRLNAFSATGPEFWTRDLEAGKLNSDFSFTDYNRAQTALVARVTRRWGWNRRDTSSNFDTEFFYFYRSLRFRQAQAVLRDHIVNEINQLLSRLGISAHIELDGYPSPSKIGELIEGAMSGALHYCEAFKLSG